MDATGSGPVRGVNEDVPMRGLADEANQYDFPRAASTVSLDFDASDVISRLEMGILKALPDTWGLRP